MAAKLAPPDIPQSLAALTPEWLTLALGEKWLDGARVSHVEAEPLGEGVGFVGQLARLRLTLDGEAPSAPRSLVAKLPTQVPENRAVGEMLGAYEREIQFYRDWAPRVAYRTARLYYADMDPNPASEHGPAIIRFLDRLPAWLMRWLLAFFGWVARKSTRRYLLLLEDLAPAELGDQVAGRSASECRAIVEHMARCQAASWGDPWLEEPYWAARLDLGLRLSRETFRGSRAAFEERFAAHLSDDDRAALAWLDAHGIELMQRLHEEAPLTLMHGDFRLDNLFFENGRPPLLVDWQGVGVAPGVQDLAYFLSGTLPPETSAEDELALVRGYHDALLAHGVDGYDFDACLRDYRRCMLLGLQRLASIDLMDMGDARGDDLIHLWVRRTVARLRGIDRDALL
ncbi:MAG: phosphotransferase [Myxococcota bacterium]